MKKLVFLAVVLIGITAMSFAQKTTSVTSGATGGKVIAPTTVSPDLNIENVTAMDFGTITNSATGGTVRLWPEGGLSASNGIVAPTTGTAATFKITGSTQFPTITIGNPHQTFGTTKFDIVQAQDCLIQPNGAYAGQYIVKVGGTLTLNAGAAGNLASIVVSVTVNAQ